MEREIVDAEAFELEDPDLVWEYIHTKIGELVTYAMASRGVAVGQSILLEVRGLDRAHTVTAFCPENAPVVVLDFSRWDNGE